MYRCGVTTKPNHGFVVLCVSSMPVCDTCYTIQSQDTVRILLRGKEGNRAANMTNLITTSKGRKVGVTL